MAVTGRDNPTAQGAGRPRRAVAAHTRPRRWRSIRVRLLVPVLIAALGIGALGAVQVAGALEVAAQADRARTLARASGVIGTLVHQIAFEYVLSNDARRGRLGRAEASAALGRQQSLTEGALAQFAGVDLELRRLAPDLVPLTDTVDQAVRGLSSARVIAEQNPDGAAEVRAFYDAMLTSLLALADALPAQMSDPRLIELSRSVALTAGLDRLAAFQLDLITRGLFLHTLQPGDPILLAQWVGAERTQIDTLTKLRPAGQLFSQLSTNSGLTSAGGIRQVILDGQGGPATLTHDPDTWFLAQSLHVNGLWDIERRLADDLAAEAESLGAAARDRTLLTVALATATVVVTLAAAVVLTARISRRLRRTRAAALSAARVELPEAIANVIAARDAGMVRTALVDSSARVNAMLPAGPDEVGELANAFGAVHRQALRLAADQALMRMEVQAMFVALSRRGQTLIQRQIHLIDEFGRDEVDPEALSRLFALDHLAARMRRNEENLLVLAGGEPGRWITRPVAMIDLIRAAAQEIDEYRRVEIQAMPAVAISAHVAGDAIHLLAEIFENATSFSPPDTTVRVSASRHGVGVSVTVVDGGIGMPPTRLAEVNDRLARPSALTSTLVGTMGLLVVARLALRHGIRVHLDSVPAGGTTATVLLPERLMMPITAYDQLQPAPRLPIDPLAAAVPATSPGDTSLEAARVPAPALTPLPLPAHRRVPDAETQPSPVEVEAELTEAGLPRRSPESVPSPDEPSPVPPGMPDPETVRARLSSLASGIAAANQAEPVLPPAVPNSR
jgi:signal transduction histidine kinase